MARGCSLAKTIRLPPGYVVEVHCVEPSGDCFYDCLDYLLSAEAGEGNSNGDVDVANSQISGTSETESTSSAISLSSSSSSFSLSRHRKHTLSSSQSMREFVADSMTQGLYDLYSMYASAGVEDYAWMTEHPAPANLEELRSYAKISGREAGADHCLWADEHAVRTLAEEAQATILIIDEQGMPGRGVSRSGKRRKGGGKRKRGGGGRGGGAAENDSAESRDGRFLSIGCHDDNCLMLVRSRREHYDAVVINGRKTFRIDELPEETRSLWPGLSSVLSNSMIGSTDKGNDVHVCSPNQSSPGSDKKMKQC